MKKLFLTLVAALGMQMMTAQNSDMQVATLQHGDQTLVFYGREAFKQAYEAAADTLDVITLSSGSFNGLSEIKKSITVYGAGFDNDTITATPRTYIEYIKDITANGVHLEGLYVDAETAYGLNWTIIGYSSLWGNQAPIYNLCIAKCNFRSLSFATNCYNCVIRQSYIYDTIYSYINNQRNSHLMHNFVISNCHINCNYVKYNIPYGSAQIPFERFSPASTIYVDHCILMGSEMSGPWRYTNNIINFTGPEGYCNIFLGDGQPNISDDMTGNWYNVSPEYVWAEEGEFALKTPEIYHATDGTEIGLHGGVYAWNKIPCTPRITECTMDTENVANGTLKVSIKAEAQTKE